jgi:hypothetical protein
MIRLSFSLFILFVFTATCAADAWQAGAASCLITPNKPMWMSGYAARDHAAEGKLHDLWAKALVLKDASGETAVLVTMDLCGIDRDTSKRICEQLTSVYGLKRESIALSTSHTHSGPVVGRNLESMYFLNESQRQQVDNYTSALIASVVQIVGSAMENLQPVRLQHGLGHAPFATNRRNNREAEVPLLRQLGELRGPVDHEVPVLAVRNQDKRLIAVVFGYACHATTLDSYFWSGDWPGCAQADIEKRHPGAIALFWAGCGADQNPIPRRSVELAVEYGARMAQAVEDVLGQPLASIDGPLRTAYQEIDLRFADLPTREQLAADLQAQDRYVASRAKQLLQKVESDGRLSETYPYPVQLWRIGNEVLFVSLGGEVVVDFSIRLKHELRPDRVWVAGYMNDVMAYIPSERVLAEGGYEGGSAMVYYGLPTSWAPGVERDIVSAVHKLSESLAK